VFERMEALVVHPDLSVELTAKETKQVYHLVNRSPDNTTCEPVL